MLSKFSNINGVQYRPNVKKNSNDVTQSFSIVPQKYFVDYIVFCIFINIFMFLICSLRFPFTSFMYLFIFTRMDFHSKMCIVDRILIQPICWVGSILMLSLYLLDKSYPYLLLFWSLFFFIFDCLLIIYWQLKIKIKIKTIQTILEWLKTKK